MRSEKTTAMNEADKFGNAHTDPGVAYELGRRDERTLHSQCECHDCTQARVHVESTPVPEWASLDWRAVVGKATGGIGEDGS